MIEIREVHKRFNGLAVLDGINLRVDRGQTKVIIGRSGCGKSVLLKHIVGLLRPERGHILINGQEITTLKESELDRVRLRIAMVFQGGALFDSLNVAGNVGFGLVEHKVLKQHELLQRINESLELVGLSGIERMHPTELSGGMKKRVALARAICIQPEIILYDEPTTGVDPITADSINDLIRSLHDKLKVTSVVVTHDMRSAYRIADKIAMLYKGTIIAEGTTEEIQNTTHPIVHQFIHGIARGPITDAEAHS